jgi:signal transduction histidine kinase
MNIFDFVDPVHADTVKSCMSYVLRTGDVSGYELAGRRGIKGIEGKVHSVRLGPILDEGKVTGLCFVATDVTETKQLHERVALSDRVASIGTLSTGVAHEINNPLTYLLLSLELAGRSGGPGKAADSWKTSIEGASEAAQRIRKIVDDMAAFGRNGSEELHPVDLEATMESTIKLAEVQTRYRARLIRDYAPTPPVLADSARLSQVFLNLLVNAAQAIDEGDVENNCITIRVRALDGETASVEITDTGGGIEDEILPRIFEPFVTTKDIGQGTGLGLHICHNIVSAFSGSLQVKTELGSGSTFTVSLPMAKDVVASTVIPAKGPQQVAREMRILIIDDEPDIAEAMQMLLTGHRVTLAGSGREALQLLEASQFDIVFCDLIMPDMTGIDVFKYIVEEQPDLANALVFMTGGAFTERARAFLDTCEQPVLAKPFTYEQVLHFVSERAASSGP